MALNKVSEKFKKSKKPGKKFDFSGFGFEITKKIGFGSVFLINENSVLVSQVFG